MGNQQSAPLPQLPPQQIAPPVPPICDLDCQRQKQLTDLKTNLDAKAATKSTDPEGYEQARISYFTLLEGQGWLAKEKQKIAKQEIEPKVSDYMNQYNSLKSEQQMQQTFSNLAASLKAQESADEGTASFLKQELQKEKDKAQTLNRQAQLGVSTASSTIENWVPRILDGLIVLLGVLVAYLLFSKMNSIKAMFGSTQNAPMPAVSGGRR